MEYYPNEIDVCDLELPDEVFVAVMPYLKREMATEYYVYGLDTKENRVAAALLCPDEQTAEWVYRNAEEQMEDKNITGHFQFGYIGISSFAAIRYTCGGFGIFKHENFAFAAKLTKKPVLIAKEYHRIANNLSDFMLCASTLLEELTTPDNCSRQAQTANGQNVPPVIIDKNLIEPIEESGTDLPIFIAASGKGKTKPTVSALKAYNNSKPLAEPPDGVIIEGIDPTERENLGESIGRNTAKWLLKANMSEKNKELQEEVLSDMGFAPIETTDMLYPDAGDDRRKISQRISKKKNKHKE